MRAPQSHLSDKKNVTATASGQLVLDGLRELGQLAQDLERAIRRTAFLLGEPVTPRTVIGGGVIILGVALIVASQSRRRGRPAPEGAAAEAVTFSANRESSTARR